MADPSDPLLRIGLGIADASTYGELAAVLTLASRSLVGAANAVVGVVTDDGGALRIHRGPRAAESHASVRLLSLADRAPLTDAVRSGQAILLGSAREVRDRYPDAQRRARNGEFTAMAAFPLVLAGARLGAFGFRFANGVGLSDERVRIMEQMVPFVARAVARIRDRDALVAYADRLEQSNRDLENFAAVVAHDLSAPVRRIGSFLQLLEREIGPLTDAGRRYATTIREQVQHLDALLKDTLAYAHVAAPSPSMEATPLAEVVADVVRSRFSHMQELGASVTVAELPVVEIEPNLMQQVFENLIDNSLKYRHHARPPHISVSAQPERTHDGELRTWWRIEVSDNGIGIDPSHHDEVFAMFARLEVSKDRPGTGVGLALIKRIVERHGGEIGLASPGGDGVGTTVWFTLPGVLEPDAL